MNIKGISEQTQIEAQIGFLGGILVGALASWAMIMFFTPWEWYFKLFATIGEIGIIGSLSLALQQTIQGRRQYIEAKESFAKTEEPEFNPTTAEELLGMGTAQDIIDEVEEEEKCQE